MTGAGGIAIATRVAEYLQRHRPGSPASWTVFHRDLVEKVLAEHNLPARLAEYMPEDRVSYIQDTVEELLGLHPPRTSLVKQVTETILGLAELGNCILIGRGAHVILAKCPTAFHVRLVSTLEKRIARYSKAQNISEQDAREVIVREDAARRRYLRSHFDADVDDPLGYHLALNTDWFSLEEAAELIGQAVLRHFPVNA
jgi:cytidylate kinase